MSEGFNVNYLRSRRTERVGLLAALFADEEPPRWRDVRTEVVFAGALFVAGFFSLFTTCLVGSALVGSALGVRTTGRAMLFFSSFWVATAVIVSGESGQAGMDPAGSRQP